MMEVSESTPHPRSADDLLHFDCTVSRTWDRGPSSSRAAFAVRADGLVDEFDTGIARGDHNMLDTLAAAVEAKGTS